jgi:hypothetical protein
MHVHADQASRLRHGWLLLCDGGPPRGVQPRGYTDLPHSRGRTGP